MNILVIDQDEAVLQSIKQALQFGGHECDAFVDTWPAACLYLNREHDVVLIDPDRPGLSVLQAIYSINGNAKIIVMSRNAADATPRMVAGRTPFGFLRKPFAPGDLIGALSTVRSVSISV